MILNLSQDKINEMIGITEVEGVKVRELGFMQVEKLEEEGLDLVQAPATFQRLEEEIEKSGDDDKSKTYSAIQQITSFDRRFTRFFIKEVYGDEEKVQRLSWGNCERLAIATYFKTFGSPGDIKNLETTTDGGEQENKNTVKTVEKSKDN